MMSIASVIASATTFLFVPGNRPERFEKAHRAGADVVIIDLEDAVRADEKAAGRQSTLDWLAAHPDAPTVVRINARGAPEFDDDVRALAGRARAVLLPKTETAEDLLAARNALGARTALIALLETARGVNQAFDIAGRGAPVRLAFGNVDFAANLHVDAHDDRALLFARAQIVMASTVAGIAAPIDGVTTAIADTDAAFDAAQRGRALGFAAKLCIHPAQIDAVKRAWQPTEAETRWARAVIDGTQNGNAVMINGEMIDPPVIARAQQILARI